MRVDEQHQLAELRMISDTKLCLESLIEEAKHQKHKLEVAERLYMRAKAFPSDEIMTLEGIYENLKKINVESVAYLTNRHWWH